MSVAHREERWGLCAGEGVRVRTFGSQALVFNPITWETHLLTALSLSVLGRLLRSPATADELARELADPRVDPAPLAALREKTLIAIEELHRLELVRVYPDLDDEDWRP